jgi:DnaJ-class molecular chaperone
MSIADGFDEDFPDLWDDDEFGLDYLDEEPCPECGGTGEVPDDGTNQGECEYCDGTGVWDGEW